MKHTFVILLVALLSMMTVDLKAQGLVYTPFIPPRPRSGYSRPSYQTQTTRTTAYFADYNGNYYKVPIKVDYTVYSNGATSLTVTEQYESNGFGGQWKRILTAANVVSCQSITANGVTAELERTFMYKAMVGTRWYYFDL